MSEEKIDVATRSIKKVVSLQYPVPIKNDAGEIEGQLYQVEVGRLKVRHLKLLPASFLDRQKINLLQPEEIRDVILAFTDLPESTCDEIDLVTDGNKILEAAQDFF